ncbi:MAG: hypothetical protein ACFFDQ_07250 [Candidatus Thorarchaeota archaeon]
MEEAMFTHSLKGLRLIADLCILEGLLLFGSSVVFLALGSLFAFIPIVAGVLMIVLGFYLDNLQRIAWWAVVITNAVSLAGVLIGILSNNIFLNNPLGTTDIVSLIINLVLSCLIVGYLLRKNVRSLFFEENAS